MHRDLVEPLRGAVLFRVVRRFDGSPRDGNTVEGDAPLSRCLPVEESKLPPSQEEGDRRRDG